MNNRLLVVATSGEVGEGARVFHSEVASHERGASGEGGAKSSNDPISGARLFDRSVSVSSSFPPSDAGRDPAAPTQVAQCHMLS